MSQREEQVASQQYDALRQYLDAFLQSQRLNNSSNQRANAREKLTRLSKLQFVDLSTDVYDEMNRRQQNSNEGL